MTAEARRLWREKLDYLLAQEPILATPAQRFELQQQIAECRAKLAELDAEDQRRRAAEHLAPTPEPLAPTPASPLAPTLRVGVSPGTLRVPTSPLTAGPTATRAARDAERPRMHPHAERGDEMEIDLSHLPAGAAHFLGREAELADLDAAWSDGEGGGGYTAIVELVAPGGTGKTALVKRWLEGLMVRGWGGARRVYAWSFYSQGEADDRQASEDHFLAAALDWFAVEIAPSANPADKGQALAEVLTRQPTLLVLDGCEPLQYPPGPLAGELRAPGLKALLAHLASVGLGAGRPGLCVLSTRERVRNLDEWVRGDTHPGGPVLRLNLENLTDPDGARLLHTLGAARAGAAPIAADDSELCAASREVRGHALTLSLLGNYLRLAHGGDIRQRDRVDLGTASAATGGHAFRVMGAYVRWFNQDGEPGARALAVLRLLGFFDRPASAKDLAALRAAPPITGLTEQLFDSSTARSASGLTGWLQFRKPRLQPIPAVVWAETLTRLQDAGLIVPPAADGTLDAHSLVRDYLADAVVTDNPDAWREGHRRIYERLKASVPHRPEGLDGLQPLYQAVAHGCRAGLWQDVLHKVYVDRILRGTGDDGFYSTRKFGAFGADLGAVGCHFAEPWSRPAPALAEGDRAWLLNDAAFSLRALGRLTEALEPMRAGAEMLVRREDWKNAAIGYGNLSELQLTLGRVFDAVADGERSVGHADRSGDAFRRMDVRTALADALHQRGETGNACERFAEAEAIQGQRQPQYPLLYSLGGLRYCELRLAGAERMSWSVTRGHGAAEAQAACEDAARRATCSQRAWREIFTNPESLIDIAFDHLIRARCALYSDRLQGRPSGTEAQAQTEQAVSGLRAAGRQDYLPLGLLTRAWLRHTLGDPAGAQSDLAEAQQIASRGGMQLFLADIALYRARLFQDREALAQARRLIEQCNYGRRLPELADAEAAAAAWSA